ncbi:hypothetical protein M1N92_04285, partial [Dehalococcoidia bacterium]|nr:hypothetical protein [Dehalococcoidia bacterium]
SMKNQKNDGLHGPRPTGPRPYGPQQVIIQPPKGYVPPLRNELQPIGVYSIDTGFWVGLPIEAFTEALVVAESKHAVDRIDERDKVEAKITTASEVGTRRTASFEVRDGEVAFLNRIVVTSPAESGPAVGDIVKVNFRISRWEHPDARIGETVNEDGRSYWSESKGTSAADTYTVDLPAQGELGEELRLVGPARVTLVAELVGAAAGTDLTATLTPYGRKARRLVE